MLSASRHRVSWNKPGMAGVAFTVHRRPLDRRAFGEVHSTVGTRMSE
jgi:hypothetical protein